MHEMLFYNALLTYFSIMISVTLLGAGNVATHLFKAFNKAKNVTVKQWFNRHLKAIDFYKNEVDTIDDLSMLKSADVYIIAINDDAISEFSSQLPLENQLVVHTSGSVGLHDLDKKLQRGVFYPLQTFSKDAEIDFANVPICVEAIEKDHFNTLKILAESIGSTCYRVNSEQRSSLHLAAVFVNNFVNQLYRIAHEITESTGADFNILKPLILETANKIQTLSPYMAQTGPAKRDDKKTIGRHLKKLENATHKAIYELLTQSIQHTHGRKKL